MTFIVDKWISIQVPFVIISIEQLDFDTYKAGTAGTGIDDHDLLYLRIESYFRNSGCLTEPINR